MQTCWRRETGAAGDPPGVRRRHRRQEELCRRLRLARSRRGSSPWRASLHLHSPSAEEEALRTGNAPLGQSPVYEAPQSRPHIELGHCPEGAGGGEAVAVSGSIPERSGLERRSQAMVTIYRLSMSAWIAGTQWPSYRRWSPPSRQSSLLTTPRHDDVPHRQVIRKPGAPDWVP